MNNIAVLIPCYNESKTVAKVVADFRQVLPEAQIIVCDNNSKDGTDEEIARAAGATVIYKKVTETELVLSESSEVTAS